MLSGSSFEPSGMRRRGWRSITWEHMCRRFVAADADRGAGTHNGSGPARCPTSSVSIAMSAVPQRAESARSVASSTARSRHKMQLAVRSFRISQNEPNFCSRLEQLTVSICEFRHSQRAASSSSRRTWRTRRAPSKTAKAEAVRAGDGRSHVDVATVGRGEVLDKQSIKTAVRPGRGRRH
jgi:hypothetical protein